MRGDYSLHIWSQFATAQDLILNFGSRFMTLRDVGQEHPDIVEALRDLDPIATASCFADLLLAPELQANCFRLESLVHLCMIYCRGANKPTRDFIVRAFAAFGSGSCGAMEDSVEDVQVALVNTPRGNYRIAQGTSSGAWFYLQRVLDALEALGGSTEITELRHSIDCLLRLSEALLSRAGLHENSVGQRTPVDDIPEDLANSIMTREDLIRFDGNDLSSLGIDDSGLVDFGMTRATDLLLPGQAIGHSDLERHPLAVRDNGVYLLLPTAVAKAITRLVIEVAVSAGLGKQFEECLCAQYGRLLEGQPILRLPRLPHLDFQKLPGGWISNLSFTVDPNRQMRLLFYVDGLTGFLRGGFPELNPNYDLLGAVIKHALETPSSSRTLGSAAFESPILLLVICGYGRTFEVPLPTESCHWQLCTISAYDLCLGSRLKVFTALAIWRLSDAKAAYEEQNIQLRNYSGLLNLAAWFDQLQGRLVAPNNAIDFFSDDSPKVAVIPTDYVCDIRRAVLDDWQPRRVLNQSGLWRRVSKLLPSAFDEDNKAPFYISEEDLEAKMLCAVYVARSKPWWLRMIGPMGDAAFHYWQMVCMWWKKAVPVLEEEFTNLGITPFSLSVEFLDYGDNSRRPVLKNEHELRQLITVGARPGVSNVTIIVGHGFADGVSQEENTAERILVESWVAGVATAANASMLPNARGKIVERICPNPRIRSFHRFETKRFRDYVAAQIPDDEPFIFEQIDSGPLEVRLVCDRYPRKLGVVRVSGITDCLKCLNELTARLLDSFTSDLRKFDRRDLCYSILLNHELAFHERDIWLNTSQANLESHEDKIDAQRTIVQYLNRFVTAGAACRIVLEAAACECPSQGGRTPGVLDMTKLMAQAILAYRLGGYSDAIRWGAIDPNLAIRPVGNLELNSDFMQSIYEPFGNAISENRVQESAESYFRLYAAEAAAVSAREKLGADFDDAWIAEFGMSLDHFRAGSDGLEDFGVGQRSYIVQMRSTSLVDLYSNCLKISKELVHNALESMFYKARDQWRIVAPPYNDKDWFPWRFRRRLSIVRRPFIQLDNSDDPLLLIAPGLIRDSLFIMAQSFYSGEIPTHQARSREMQKWIGHANHTQRLEFNQIVADKMKGLGWQVDVEVKVTRLLRRGFDRDYGDIDVLAWRKDSGRILVMECKDLQFNKTMGEVAEQLADFRGSTQADGKPDQLKKHLDRLELLREYEPTVGQALGLPLIGKIEGHLVFRKPVPIQFVAERLAKEVRVSLLDELGEL